MVDLEGRGFSPAVKPSNDKGFSPRKLSDMIAAEYLRDKSYCPHPYFYEYSTIGACVNVSRGTIQASKGRNMLDPAQTQTLTRASQRRGTPWPASNHSSPVTHHCPNQSLVFVAFFAVVSCPPNFAQLVVAATISAAVLPLQPPRPCTNLYSRKTQNAIE